MNGIQISHYALPRLFPFKRKGGQNIYHPLSQTIQIPKKKKKKISFLVHDGV